MPQVDFTLEDIRKLVKEEVGAEVGGLRAEFQSFIDDNFNPAMERIDERFDNLEDRADRISKDVSELRIDVRHLKQTVRSRT